MVEGRKRLKRRGGMLCYVLSFRLSPPDTQPGTQLITELADVSAIVETSAIVTVLKFLPMTDDLSPVEDSCAHQGFSELFVLR